MNASRSIWAVALACLAAASSAQASYGIYVGRNLTQDGSVLLGGSGEEVSSHWLNIQSRQKHPKDAKVTVGVTEQAVIPGKLTKIPQVETTFRFISMDR